MKDFSNKINQLLPKHNITNVFDDFMEMAICALSFGHEEERYNQLAQNYTVEELDILGRSMGSLFNEYEESINKNVLVDVLGDFFMETNSYRTASDKGQFFTPLHICIMMSKMVSSKDAKVVNDPSSGSGRNLIAHAFNHSDCKEKSFYTGMDLDKRCVNMTALNMFFYSMNGVVIHMDSLFYDIYGGYRIYPPHTFQGIQRLTKEQCIAFLPALHPRGQKDIEISKKLNR